MRLKPKPDLLLPHEISEPPIVSPLTQRQKHVDGSTVLESARLHYTMFFRLLHVHEENYSTLGILSRSFCGGGGGCCPDILVPDKQEEMDG